MPRTFDIAELDLNSLKILAYDTNVQLNLQRQNLQVVENEIAKRIQAAEVKAAGPPGPSGPPGPPAASPPPATT